MSSEIKKEERRESDYWGAFSRNLFVLSIVISPVSFWKWEFGIISGVLMLGAIYSVKVSEIAERHEEHVCENEGACTSLNKNLQDMVNSIHE